MYFSILRHKHGQLTSTQTLNSLWRIILAFFLTVSLLPGEALAFETSLISSTPKLASLLNNGIAISAENEDSATISYTATSVIAGNSPITNKSVATLNRVASSTVKTETVSYIPDPNTGSLLVLEGEASYYSRAGCLGCDPNMIMANGQPLNDNDLTMAIGADRKHFVGHQAKVTSLVTGKSVMVKITDTGGFYQAKYGHRVADLTVATKQAIGMIGGVGQVRVEVY